MTIPLLALLLLEANYITYLLIMSSTTEKCGQKRPPPFDDGGGGKKRTATAPSAEEEDTCWLCLDVNHDSGQPLRRDCSCRGGSGFAHLHCIVEYAKQKTEQWHGGEDPDPGDLLAWMDCPNCKQEYQNQLGVDTATEFIKFIEGKYQMISCYSLKRVSSKFWLF